MSNRTRQLCYSAILAAMTAVLGYTAIDLGNLKVTFESLPILLGAILFGPVEGLLIGGVGTFIYQMLRYGVSATTLLWMLPYIVAGFMMGYYSKRKEFRLSAKQILIMTFACEIVITAINTVAMYIDSKIYGYYSFAYIFGSLGVRSAVCIGRAIVFGLLLPALVKACRATLVPAR